MVTVRNSNEGELVNASSVSGTLIRKGESSTTPTPLISKVKPLALMETALALVFSNVPEKVSVCPGVPLCGFGVRVTVGMIAA